MTIATLSHDSMTHDWTIEDWTSRRLCPCVTHSVCDRVLDMSSIMPQTHCVAHSLMREGLEQETLGDIYRVGDIHGVTLLADIHEQQTLSPYPYAHRLGALTC